ncbi:hypothetical protein BHE74_00044388 [Ensete ventricosum]|nr:hypothetical protein BHE74_00044388 [Ensete ventricosum]
MTTLPLTIGEEPRTKTVMVVFMVVDLPSAYNAIIGRPTLNRLRAVVSIFHHSMKFPTDAGVSEARSDSRESRQCYLTTTILPKKPRMTSPGTDPRGPIKLALNPEPVEGVKEIVTDPRQPDKALKIGSTLSSKQQVKMIEFLKENTDLFAWTPEEMSDIDSDEAQHYQVDILYRQE